MAHGNTRVRSSILQLTLSGGGVRKVANFVHSSLSQIADIETMPLLREDQAIEATRSGSRLGRQFERMVRIRRHVQALNPDLIVAHSIQPAILATFLAPHVPAIVVLHGALFADRSLRLRRKKLVELLLKTSLRRAAGVVAVSDGVGGDAVRLVPSLAPHVVWNGLTEHVAGPLVEPPVGAPPMIMFLGRLHVQKTPEMLPDLVARGLDLQTRRLLILGDGPESARIARRFAELGVSVRRSIGDRMECGVFMPGHVDAPESLIDTGTVVLSPSRWEGFPLNIVEALVHGAAVVAADCDHGPREIKQILSDSSVGASERLQLLPAPDATLSGDTVSIYLDAVETAMMQNRSIRSAELHREALLEYFGPAAWRERWVRTLVQTLEPPDHS